MSSFLEMERGTVIYLDFFVSTCPLACFPFRPLVPFVTLPSSCFCKKKLSLRVNAKDANNYTDVNLKFKISFLQNIYLKRNSHVIILLKDFQIK